MAYVDLANRVYNGPGYMDLGAPSGVVWDARLDLLPLSTSANASTLRAALAAMGLTLTRASAATVQTSASEVVTSGIGVDDPRVGRYGLVIEEARTNYNPYARSLATADGWTAGTVTYSADALVSPDGTTSADREEIAAAAFGRYRTILTATSTTTASMWRRSGTSTPKSHAWYIADGANVAVNQNDALSTAWERSVLTLATPGGGVAPINTCDGRLLGPPYNLTQGARDVAIDLVQVEVGKFATEAILTTGAAATRAGDKLAIDTSARLVRSGRIGIETRFVPKFANTDITGSWAYRWSMDGNNQAYLQKSDNKIRVWSNGVSFTTTSGPSWSAGDTVDMWIEAGGGSLVTRVVYRVNGGAATVLGTSGAPQASLVSGTGVSFLSEVTATSQSSSWVQRIRAYAPGRRPSWAA